MYKHLMVNNEISGVWEEIEYSTIFKLEESVAFFKNTEEFFGVFVVYYGHTEIVIFICSTSCEL